MFLKGFKKVLNTENFPDLFFNLEIVSMHLVKEQVQIYYTNHILFKVVKTLVFQGA